MMNEAVTSPVEKRRVFYIPGYDPIPPRRYRELYRTEGAKQAEISGYQIALSAKKGERFGWSVDGQIEGQETHTEMDVLVWADIVQSSMDAGILRTYLILIQTAWTYISTGALFRLMKLRRGPVYAALYPVAILLVQLLAAILMAWAITIGMQACARLIGIGWFAAPAWGIGTFSAYTLLRWFKKKDGRFFAYYLMHDYGFSARWRGAEPPVLKERMAEFETAIAQALTEDWDEVLVVGHSSGAHLAVSVLANVIRKGGGQDTSPSLSFLSLGQVVPMVSFLPEAKDLRRDLAYLSARNELFWLDVTAPGDPCCFALCDPIKTSSVAPVDQTWPLVISAAFTQTLSPELQATLKNKFFRLHFQYLCAFDRPLSYDYFKVTAGPQTLNSRFSDHDPTPSRIDTPANTFTEMAS